MRMLQCFLLSFLAFTASAVEGQFVQINIPVACMREGKSHSSQLVSQVVMGTPMQVIEQDDEWWLLTGPDGYKGYVNASGFVNLDSASFLKWRSAPRLKISSIRESVVYSRPFGTGERDVVTTLVNGSIVSCMPDKHDDGYYTGIILPDGREGYISSQSVVPLDSLPLLDKDDVITNCYKLMDTPYLWGGCSTKAMYCSGLVLIVYFDKGILLPRDAKDQYLIGEDVTDNPARGDLLFFSSTPDGGITHVALYDDDGIYVHCSGMVRVSRMDISDPDFAQRIYRGARRINCLSRSCDVTPITTHPWFF